MKPTARAVAAAAMGALRAGDPERARALIETAPENLKEIARAILNATLALEHHREKLPARNFPAYRD